MYESQSEHTVCNQFMVPRGFLIQLQGPGVLMYFGITKASKGEKKCGVALDSADNGKHDGMVNGQR